MIGRIKSVAPELFLLLFALGMSIGKNGFYYPNLLVVLCLVLVMLTRNKLLAGMIGMAGILYGGYMIFAVLLTARKFYLQDKNPWGLLEVGVPLFSLVFLCSLLILKRYFTGAKDPDRILTPQ